VNFYISIRIVNATTESSRKLCIEIDVEIKFIKRIDECSDELSGHLVVGQPDVAMQSVLASHYCIPEVY